MKAYVVVEGATDVAILRAVLPNELLATSALVAAGGRSSLLSIARSLIVTRRKPLAVLVETDSIDSGIIQERRQSAEELIQAVATGIPSRVILIVPQLEVVFFQVPGLLPRVLGHAVPTDVLLLARFVPKEALDQLLAGGPGPRTLSALLDALSTEEIEGLRSTGPIAELIGFLNTGVQDRLRSSAG